jgi:hypothetical protein
MNMLNGNETVSLLWNCRDSLLQEINNRRIRQLKFLDACIQHLKKQKRSSWMVNIQADEYLVVNPRRQKRPEYIHYPCVSLARVSFGGVATTEREQRRMNVLDPNQFETLRWKFHAPFDTQLQLNGASEAH